MARKPRLQYEGAIYHVMNRGDRREDIFHDDDVRQLFLKTLGGACDKTGWQVHAYCMMRNHFHLVAETRERGRSQVLTQKGAPAIVAEWLANLGSSTKAPSIT